MTSETKFGTRTGIDKEILSKEGDGTTSHRGWRLGKVESKEHMYQTTIEEAESKLYSSFEVLERKGSRAYKLEISPRWKIHPVFHVSLWEPYRVSN